MKSVATLPPSRLQCARVSRIDLLFLSGDQRRRRAIAGMVLIAVLFAGLVVAGAKLYGASASRLTLSRWVVPARVEVPDEPPRLQAAPLTDALRARGHHECNPHDPIGLGPYSRYHNVALGGHMLIPQRGGHTDEMGYDVLLHFHGHEALRKTLVQVSRGVVFVGFDKGLGSGAYSRAFAAPKSLRRVLDSVRARLVEYTGDSRAHVRRVALSAWSAGYGAVNEILKYAPSSVDAVVLLDGLHAGWDPSRPHARGVTAVSGAAIAPTLRYAARAQGGEGSFVFTHSEVDPVTYPSTELTAGYLLAEIGLEPVSVAPRVEAPRELELVAHRSAAPPELLPGPAPPVSDAAGAPVAQPYPMRSRVDVAGLHVWGYAGADQRAHCSHIAHISRVLSDVLERTWQTPRMDRDVPFQQAPKLGSAPKPADTAEPRETTQYLRGDEPSAEHAVPGEATRVAAVAVGEPEPAQLPPPSVF
jgi:hypothetical protein